MSRPRQPTGDTTRRLIVCHPVSAYSIRSSIAIVCPPNVNLSSLCALQVTSKLVTILDYKTKTKRFGCVRAEIR